MIEETPYNPLDKKNLGISVADSLLMRKPIQLPLEEPFEGAGIYTIYYVGDFSLYEPIAAQNRNGKFTCPIYVGKAIPPGARQGGIGLDAKPGKVLFSRIREHCKSLDQAKNLEISDFYCRYLVVEDIWIPLGESLLIQSFSPIWNCSLDGFGNHAPGSGRYKQQRSPWDVIHPGRDWAVKCADHQKSKVEIINSLNEFMASYFGKK